ncbi:MAG: DUF3293 domain-containing protein [Wenzhouxiangella sp.]|nr:DUF3293 domain-containing protein [Wenzhouxiangella sp.]MCH8476771.1 DUF3293 domain-containing protein [Wenzhouxiangella sp.]
MESTVATDLDPALLDAFLAAEYQVVDGEARLSLTIGRRHPKLDQRLRRHPWAILTAFNPGANQLPDDANQQRHNQLQAASALAGLESLPTINRAPGHNWPDEHGLLLLAPDRRWLILQARRFGQLAVVCGEPGGQALLGLLDPCPVNPLPAAVFELHG